MTTTEAHARVRINSLIESAGFKLFGYEEDDPFVSYERAVHNPIMHRRLKDAGKIPDYHFYLPNSTTPIAFLEAKRPGGKRLDQAIDQACEYAIVACDTDNPPMVVFASDGIQVKSRHADGRELTLNNYPVDYIPTPDLMQALIEFPSTQQGEAVHSVSELINLFKGVSDLMRADGIDAGINRLREFCILLFIKIMSERGIKDAMDHWDGLRSKSGNSLMTFHAKTLKTYRQRYGDLCTVSELQNPHVLENMIAKIDPINFTNSGMDIKGQAFEYFLANYSAGNTSELGQFFTPRHITSLMAKLLEPRAGDKILDPFCGTGGMLITCYTQISTQLDSQASDIQTKLRELKRSTLYGNDISSGVSSLAKMNMILLGDGQSNIRREDSFVRLEKHKYDKVITNIPFNLKAPIDHEKLSDLIKPGSLTNPDWNELCIVKCIESLKPGGAAAIVLPLTICVSDRYVGIRRYISRTSRIRACIRLPEKTFISYTSAQTAVLLIDDAHQAETDEFTFVHIKSDGMSQDTNRDPIPENDIPLLLELSVEGRLDDFPDSAKMKFSGDGPSRFVEFAQLFGSQENVWKLSELLTLKEDPISLVPEKYYAEPGLDSQTNTVKIRGNLRLGKNIKASEKVVAEPDDLIIGTLHTNRGNGLFGIADRHYICTSQIVAKIRKNVVPRQYLIQALRKEFPRQLIPTDLVGRENFTKSQILNVLIPKPSQKKLEKLRKLQGEVTRHETRLKKNIDAIDDVLESIT